MAWIEFDKHQHKIEPGVLLKTTEGKVFLVGDINVVMGQCDCCRLSSSEIAYYSTDILELLKQHVNEK